MHEQNCSGMFSEQVIASIIYDSRCGMSDAAFRTAPPIGEPSCLNFGNCQPEVISDVISGMVDQDASMDVWANFRDSRLKLLLASFSALF